MAEVDGGSLSFKSLMDNSQLDAAIEETMRRVQGMSDGMVSAGDTMDATTQEMIQSIERHRAAITDLETNLSDLNAKIAEMRPGEGQNALIEQARKLESQLVNEKMAVTELTNGFLMASDSAAAVGKTFDEMDSQLGKIAETVAQNERVIGQLEAKYQEFAISQEKAFLDGRVDESNALKSQMQAIRGEITVRKNLNTQLRNQANELSVAAARLKEYQRITDETIPPTDNLKKRIKELTLALVEMEAAGQRNTQKYRDTRAELASLVDAMGDAKAQASILANDEAGFRGVLSGLTGLAGGLSAATGMIGLFGDKNEDLQEILMKTQSIMAVTNGLMQVSQTLNKDSAFMLGTVGKLKEWWNNLLDVGRNKQAASNAVEQEAIATKQADTTATVANTAATEVNSAEQTKNATVTAADTAAKKTKKTATVADTTATVANTAATGAQSVAAKSGTVANIGLAGAFRMVGAAIKSIPVFGWILAGISGLIALYEVFSSKASKAQKAQEEFSKALIETSYKPIAKIEELSGKWNELGDNMAAKQKFVLDNQSAFNELGVAVQSVTDCENLLINNKDAFIESQTAKAKAIAYSQMAAEKYKEYLEKLEERDKENSNGNVKLRIRGGLPTFVDLWREKNEEAQELLAESNRLFEAARGAEAEGFDAMQNAGIEGANSYAEGTLGAIEHAIQLKQAALQRLTSNAEYAAAIKEIIELQKQADEITGTTRKTYSIGGNSYNSAGQKVTGGGGGSKKDPFLEKLQKRKAEYDRFLKWVNSGDAILAQSAQKEFESILAEGKTYIEYLKNQRDQILAVDVSKRTKAQNQQLRTLNDQIAEETKKTVLESFNQELSDQLSNAKSVLEMLNIIEQRRQELANDGTELDNSKKDVLDEAEKKAREQAKSEMEALLETYAGYVQRKKKLEEDFNRDIALLNKARLEATTEADRAAIDAAIANRTNKFNMDNRGSGDEEYDKLKEQYRSYQQQISDIRRDFEDKRRIATEHGDTELLARLANEEARQLSELQRKMLEESVDWQQLFGDLDSLSTATIERLIQQIKDQKLQFGAEFSPEDLRAINEQLEKARQEIESRNPFKALGAAYSRLREQMRNNKLLDSKDEFVQELQGIEQQYKQYQAWITSGNQTLADGAQQNFAELLKNGGTYLEYLKKKKQELQGKIEMGVDVGNSMQIIDAMIARVESGKSSADLMKEALKDSFSSLGSSLEFVKGAFDAVVGGMEKMGVQMDEETQAILGDIGGILEGAQNVAQGIATGNPLSIIQGSISLISSAFDLFNSRDRKAEKSIKRHKKNIEDLQNAYNQLSWAIDKALGGEVYKNQQAAIKNMKKQQQELYGMISDENSKKHTDSDKIREYREQIAELDRQIKDMLDSIASDILQTDAKGFADTLSGALVDAFMSGEDAAKAFESTVNEVLRNAIVNQLKKKFLETQLQGALDNLYNSMGYWDGDNFIFDGLTDAEIAAFKAKVQAAANNFNQALDIYKDLFTDIMGDDEAQDGLTGAVKGVTEETANILAGQMNAIRINQIEAAQVLRQQLQALNTIANNTSYNHLLQNILSELQALKTQRNETDSARSQGLI